MADATWQAIDWSVPWLAPWRGHGEPLARQLTQGVPQHDALNAAAEREQCPVRFVPQDKLPTGQAYERYIFESKQCPVRGDYHDFFNGICWLGLPQTKKRLNQLQAAEIEARGVGATRGAVRDAITLFDESGAVLQAPDALWQALCARDWQRLFIDLRPLWQQARLLVVGHSLLEKLVNPRKGVTAHVLRLEGPAASMAEIDRTLAERLTAQSLAPKPFVPLPLLGVPGWWAANASPDFYADADVFRPARATGAC